METDKITSSYRVSLGETQTTVDVTMQNEEGNIKKVLSNGAVAYIDEIEMLNGEAHYMGGVVFDLLFLNEEGENCVLSEKVELNGKIQNDQINPLMKPVFKVETVETKVVGIDGDTAKLSATIAIKLDAIQTDQIDEVKVNDDNIQLNMEQANVVDVVCNGTKTFEINEVFETKADVLRVLGTKAHIDIKNVDDATGYFEIDGNLFVNTLLEVEGEEERTIKNFMETIPFREELECEQIQKGDNVLAFAYIRPQDVLVEYNNDEDTSNKTLTVKAVVNVKYIVKRNVQVEVCTDAFSMTNKTNTTSATFITSTPEQVEKFTSTVEGQTMLDDEDARIAKICAITNEHILIANTFVEANKLVVEGVAYATVIYLTDDEIPTYDSVDLEIPFANKFDIDKTFDGSLFVVGEITDIDSKVKKGKEINIEIDVCFMVYSYNQSNQVVVKDIELTEPLKPSEYCLEMYVAPKGSTLWDISKHLLVNQETLLAQNSGLEFPLESPQTIVHFIQKI